MVAHITTSVADSEGGIVSGKGAVWMLTDAQGTLLCVDPTSNRIVAQIPTAPGSFVPAAGAGALWVTSTAENLLCRADPRSRQVVARIDVGASPRFLAVGEGADLHGCFGPSGSSIASGRSPNPTRSWPFGAPHPPDRDLQQPARRSLRVRRHISLQDYRIYGPGRHKIIMLKST
jgi:hypothetical protein